MKKRSLILAIGCIASGSALGADCRYERELSLDMDPSNRQHFEIQAEAGRLEIRGSDSADTVRIRARACTSDEDMLDRMSLDDSASGDALRVVTRMPDADGGWWDREYAYMDVEVTVPSWLAVEAEDGSGETFVTGVARLKMRDGSGELTVENIAGDVEIRDGSGEVDLRNVTGNVRIEDGSGEIRMRGIDGSVTVEEDGSGEIDIDTVGVDVIIESDGSGPIDISNVAGNVRIGRDGSGSIDVRDVAGDFEVGSDGSGGIRYSRVQGRVRIPGKEYE